MTYRSQLGVSIRRWRVRRSTRQPDDGARHAWRERRSPTRRGSGRSRSTAPRRSSRRRRRATTSARRAAKRTVVASDGSGATSTIDAVRRRALGARARASDPTRSRPAGRGASSAARLAGHAAAESADRQTARSPRCLVGARFDWDGRRQGARGCGSTGVGGFSPSVRLGRSGLAVVRADDVRRRDRFPTFGTQSLRSTGHASWTRARSAHERRRATTPRVGVRRRRWEPSDDRPAVARRRPAVYLDGRYNIPIDRCPAPAGRAAGRHAARGARRRRRRPLPALAQATGVRCRVSVAYAEFLVDPARASRVLRTSASRSLADALSRCSRRLLCAALAARATFQNVIFAAVRALTHPCRPSAPYEDARRHPSSTGRDASPPKTASPSRRPSAGRSRLAARRRDRRRRARRRRHRQRRGRRRSSRATAAKPSSRRRHHPSGTHRVAEVARRAEFAGFDVIVNVQGDEPFVSARARARRDAHGDRAQLSARHRGRDARRSAILSDPNVVKVVAADDGRAMYFSRARDSVSAGRRRTRELQRTRVWQHIGVYAYERSALMQWIELPRESARADRAARAVAAAGRGHGDRRVR